jgi:hypothetical protein
MISASAIVSLSCERLSEFRGSQGPGTGANIKKRKRCCQYTLNIRFIEESGEWSLRRHITCAAMPNLRRDIMKSRS